MWVPISPYLQQHLIWLIFLFIYLMDKKWYLIPFIFISLATSEMSFLFIFSHLCEMPVCILCLFVCCLLSYLCAVLSRSVVSDSLWPHGLLPARLLCPWGSPGKNTEMGCHALLQGIFPAQGSNPGLPHCRRILYCLSHLIPYLLICRNSLCVLDTNPLSDLADF